MNRLVFALLVLLALLLVFYYMRSPGEGGPANPPAFPAPPANAGRAAHVGGAGRREFAWFGAVEVPVLLPSRIFNNYVNRIIEIFARQMERRRVQLLANDPQNVHDSTVVEHIRQKYQRLVALTEPEMLANWREQFDLLLTLTKEEILKENTRQEKAQLQQALKIYNRSNTIDNLECSDAEVLIRVWQRLNHEANAGVRSSLVDTLHLQLVDSLDEDNQPVCVTGRVSRLLCTFTFSDVDEELARPEKDSRAYLTEILSCTSRLMEKIFEEEEFKTYKDADELPPAVTAALKKRIEASLRQEYATILPARSLDVFIAEALKGV